ncbi:MAG TPA: ATP-binding protein, partial [Patescibacteria group bacterium]
VKEDGSLYPNQELPTIISLEQGKLVTKNDIFIKRPNESKIALKVTSAPILDEQGKVVMSITVFEDITQEKEIDKMKTDFISLTSHQLRSPLVATRWLLEMLNDSKIGSLNSEQKELIKDIESSNNRMIDLVNIFLNVSRIETGGLMITPIATDFKVFIGEIQKELDHLIQENKLNFVVKIEENIPVVDLDQKLIKEVYINLLSNAIKYSPQGSNIILSVEIKDGQVISKVSDQGYGIPMQEQHNVFKKLFRAENIITKFPYGNGLGLYLAKAIVEMSGGKIGFESVESKGTTFWFTLPLRGVIAKKGEVTITPSTIQ